MKRNQITIGMVITGFLAVCIGRATATEGTKGITPPLTTNLVATVLVAEKVAVALGDPINVSLSLEYRGDLKTEMDSGSTAFDCFEVTDADGQSAPYVGYVGQIISSRIDVEPSSTVSLAMNLDLTDKYLFRKTGRYTIRFRGHGRLVPSARIVPPRSNTITVEVTQGQLSELDRIVAKLLPNLPSGWTISKGTRAEQEVTPFGRARIPGYRAMMGRHYRGGEAVFLWLTTSMVPTDAEQKADRTSEYLGRMRTLHVYVSLGSKAKELWPNAIADISRVLTIEKEYVHRGVVYGQ